MKKQLIRIAALTLFVTTFAITSARAQNPTSNQMVTIPFDFFVGAAKLPAGDYVVRAEDSGTTMKIQHRERSSGLYFMIHPVQSPSVQDRSKLVFHKYGDDYFLSQVWTAGRASGEELNKSKSQRALDRKIAMRASKPESVAVTFRAN
jgi:hypothetical protein